MRDYEELFAKNLQQKLKDKVHGKVFVNVKNNELYVHIQCWSDIDCETRTDKFAERIMNGMTTDYLCYEILEQYKRFILNTYLK